MPQQLERRIDQSRELTRLAVVVEGIDKNMGRDRSEFMSIFEQIRDSVQETNDLLSSHINDDNNLRNRVDNIEKWKDGKNGKNGAEDDLRNIGNQRYWIYGLVAGISMGGGAIGAWASKLISAVGK